MNMQEWRRTSLIKKCSRFKRIATRYFFSLNNIVRQWIKKETCLQATLVQVARQVAIITWFLREEHRERKNRRGCRRSRVESFKFSAEVARCRDTDCKRYRLSKFGETVSRRNGGGVSEGNFHPLSPSIPSRLPSPPPSPPRGNSRQRPPVIGATFVASELHFHWIWSRLYEDTPPVDPAIPQAI